MLSRLLRKFSIVAEAGSVVRAAAVLRVAQPALTRQIQQLEDEVGAQLFIRGRRGMALTPAGTVLLDATRSLFDRFELAIQHAREADSGTRGVVRVGLGRIAIDHPVIGCAIATVRRRYPLLRLEVHDVPSGDQPFALRAREIDVAIGAIEFGKDSNARSELLCEDVVDRAVVPSNHPLASQGEVTLAELAALRYLTLDTPVGAFPRVLDALKAAGLARFEPYHTVETVYNMVAAGRGWTCAPQSMQVHPPVGTTMVALRDFSVTVPIHVGWRDADDHGVSNVVCALLEEMGRPGPLERRAPKRRARQDAREAITTTGGVHSVDLEQLRTLATVIREGSVSRAAARLHVSQPAVSRRLRALERATGLHLFHNVSHGVLGTAAAHALASEADALVRLALRAKTRARHAAEGIRNSYTIAALPLEVAGGVLLHPLRQIHERLPHVAVTVSEMVSEHAVRAVGDGSADIALVARYPGATINPQLASIQMDEDTIDCVLLPAVHALAKRAWLTPAELADQPFVFILRQVAPHFHDAVMRALAAIDLRPYPIASFDAPRPMWRAAVNSMAWTVGRRSQRQRPPVGLVAIPLEGLHVPSESVLLWRRGEHDTGLREVVDVFRASLVQESRSA